MEERPQPQIVCPSSMKRLESADPSPRVTPVMMMVLDRPEDMVFKVQQ